MDLSRTQRQYSHELPRFWIALPVAVRRSALDDPLLAGLFPSHVGFFPRAKNHRIARNAGLGSTIFNYCVAGRGWCKLGNARHAVGPGDLMVVPEGEPHAYGSNPDEPWTLHWFHAMGDNVGLLSEHLGVTTKAPVAHLGRSPELEALFDEVRETLEDDSSQAGLLYAAQVLSHLFGVMIRLRQRPQTAPSARARVLASLEFMKNRLAAPLDVKKLASLAGLSPSHYSELVHRATGRPPKGFLTQLRVERAAELLDSTELPVKAIAREVGYTDPLHFSRVFRKLNGKSPRKYRAKRGPVC